jgi:NarL family two-component system sensor histidine kinase LiaS
VTEAWSRGDFSEHIDDPLGDEISQLASQLNHMAGLLEELLESRQRMAVSEERNRLARDLHDSAKQEALAASFQLGSALAYLEENPQKAKEHLREAEGLVDSVREELSALIHELRPTNRNEGVFEDLIRDLQADWSNQNDVQADLSLEGQIQFSLEQEQALYRIIKEVLANVARHSQAEHVKVALFRSEGVYELQIEDDGVGFDLDLPREGFGLQSMSERAESLGGSFQVESTPGNGTRIRVRFPLSDEEDLDE